MYVPRPKRASLDSKPLASRSRSSSRTSTDNDTCDQTKTVLKKSMGDATTCESTSNRLGGEGDLNSSATKNPDSNVKTLHCLDTFSNYSPIDISASNTDSSAIANVESIKNSNPSNMCSKMPLDFDATILPLAVSYGCTNTDRESRKTSSISGLSDMIVDSPVEELQNAENGNLTNNSNVNDSRSLEEDTSSYIGGNKQGIVIKNNESKESVEQQVVECAKPDSMEAVNAPSDSKDSMVFSSCNADSSKSKHFEKMKSITVRETKNGCVKTKAHTKAKSNMILSQHSEDVFIISDSSSSNDESQTITKDHSKANGNMILSQNSINVAIISDSSSSNDDGNSFKQDNSNNSTVSNVKVETVIMEKANIDISPKDADILDWESLYDDDGECLVPDLMEEVSK